jgi:nicotinamidase-related amidase
MEKSNKKSKKCNTKKIKIQKVIFPEERKRVLIVENPQNCFFTGGSMGFIKKLEEKRLVEYINKLINLQTVDYRYINSAQSGMLLESDKLQKLLGENKKGVKSSGSRIKNFFDFIIFTQVCNSPDHWTFSSHHYLRNTNYKYFTEINEEKKSYFKCDSKKGKDKCKGEYFLLPDHALTDGSDSFVLNGKEVHGIDFHQDLDTSSLFRPNLQYSKDVFINEPYYHNRGFIVSKGSINKSPYSAFKNTLQEGTCLSDFLKKNKVNSLYVCGIGRENTIKRTLLDSLNFKFIKERVLVYNATMPILVEPINEDDEDVKMVLSENSWTEKLYQKGIITKNAEEVFDIDDVIETKYDKSKVSEGVNSMVSVFKNSRSPPQMNFNDYSKLIQKRTKTKKNNKNNKNTKNTKNNKNRK